MVANEGDFREVPGRFQGGSSEVPVRPACSGAKALSCWLSVGCLLAACLSSADGSDELRWKI